MTHDTFESATVYEVFAGGNPRTSFGKIGEASMQPGHVIRDDNGTLYLAKASDKKASGVLYLKNGLAMDTAYTSQDLAEYYPCGFGAIVWVWLLHVSAAIPIRKGDLAVLSTTDGLVSLFAYTNSTDITDTLMNVVGRVYSYSAGHVTNDLLVKIILSI